MASEKIVMDDNIEVAFGSHISSEEKAEILSEIEESVAASKSPITEAALKLNPVKRGMAFPMVINIIMLLAVVASFFASRMLFEQRQGEITQETQFYLSAEGKLLEELRRESQEALSEKDQQIGIIQQELEDLDRRSNELSANMEATINAREQELRREMEAALALERERLAGEGSSQEEIQAKIVEMESQLQNQNTQALDSFRAASERALQEQKRELEQTIALNQSLLEDANSEKIRLEEESLAREAEMASEFEAEKAALEASTVKAREALANLAALQEQQYLLDDQVLGTYRSIIEQINIKDYESALRELGSLKNLITSENVQSIPAFAKKQPVDLFILETLREQIETSAIRSGTSSSSLAAAADLLIATEELAIKGLEAYTMEDSAKAYEYLTAAIRKIPKIGESYDALIQIETQARDERVALLLANADEFSRNGDFTSAVESYIKAVEEGAPENSGLLLSSVNSIISLYDKRHADLLGSNNNSLTDLRNEQAGAIANLKREQQAALTSLQRRHESAVSRIDQENRTIVRELEEAKDSELTRLQQKIAEQETALALQKIALVNAETALLEYSAASEQELSALEEGLAGNKKTLEEQYESAIAEIEARYQDSLSERDTQLQEALNSLQGEHEIALENLKTEQQSVLDEKERILAERDQNIFTLSASLTEKEESLDELKSQYALLVAENEARTAGLTAASAETTELNLELERYRTLAADYAILKSRMDRLMNTGKPNDFFQAEELLLGFLDENLKDFLPGASDIIEKTANAMISSTEDNFLSEGISTGREEALTDILEYTGYLATGGNAEDQARLFEELKTKAEKDGQYAQAIKEIEDLIMEGASLAAQATSVLGRPQLLGTVSRVSGNTIVIEALADLSIAEGMEISVRRKSRRSDEIVLASGEITSVNRDFIEAELKGNLGGGRVEIADFVYVTVK